MEAKKRGLLIAFEGLDRSGKSTQSGLLEEYLKKYKQKVVSLKFPQRDTLTGKTIDDYLKGKNRPNDQVIHQLFSANRWEFQQQILNDLENGIHVILDRYAYSGVAYSSAKGLDLQWCKNSDIGLPQPDIIFFMEMDEKEGTTRKDYGDEIYERSEFQQKVKVQYDKLKETFWTIINATDTIKNIHQIIIQELDKQKYKQNFKIKTLFTSQQSPQSTVNVKVTDQQLLLAKKQKIENQVMTENLEDRSELQKQQIFLNEV